jgi:GTP cyclohydrolase I
MSDNLPDVQEKNSPEYEIYIPKVGVENIKLPFNLLLRNGNKRQLIANTSISTDLADDKKGISMSRLLLSIEPWIDHGLNWDIIKKCLDDISESIGSKNSYIKFDFELPMDKASPITNHHFPIFYKCYFEGHKHNKSYEFFQSVEVQYSSYCPCSAALSEDLVNNGFPQGFPHAQRSYAKVILNIDLVEKKYVWLEDIIDVINNNIHTQPYPIIKRLDEQEIAKIASENPLFVEDAVRIISYHLNKLMGYSIIDWIVKCKHEESIHTHEAIAINYAKVANGFRYNDV